MTTRHPKPGGAGHQISVRELEADLEEYPDERGEIMVETAWRWHEAGEHDRAIGLLTEAVELGGDDGGNARVTLAEVFYDLDRADDAEDQLETLRRERPTSPGPYYLAAELFEDRGDLQQALTWFNMAVSRLTEEELSERDSEFWGLSFANGVLGGRRRVREALGIPPDELDESVSDLSELSELAELADRLGAMDPARSNPGPPREVRILFWADGEIQRAHELWPEFVEHADAHTAVAEREAANRALSDSGVARITMVPLTTAKLAEFAARTGGDPTDQDTRLACIDELVRDGGSVSWPPPRNAPCWCGSGAKYKKCCGRPRID